jgi:hypothetical protein
VPAMRNFVRLLLYFRFSEITESVASSCEKFEHCIFFKTARELTQDILFLLIFHHSSAEPQRLNKT